MTGRIHLLLVFAWSLSACATGAGPVARDGAQQPPSGPTDLAVDAAVVDAEPPPTPEPEPNCHAVISEVLVADSHGAQFIELFNPCVGPVDLDGTRLSYLAPESGPHILLVDLSAKLDSGAHVVVANDFALGEGFRRSLATSLSATGGSIAFERGGRVLDAVGWGSAQGEFVEGAAVPLPRMGRSFARVPDGQDSNRNSLDFVERPPTPLASN